MKRYGAIILYSFVLATLLSCSIRFSYSRKDIPDFVEKTCREEYGLKVHAWAVGDSLWVYSLDSPKGWIPPLGVSQWLKRGSDKDEEKLGYHVKELDVTVSPSSAQYKINAQPKVRDPFLKPKWEEDPIVKQKIQDFVRAVFNVVWRANLAIENPFKFTVVIAGHVNSDQNQYVVSFFPDTLKLNMGQISLKENEQRSLGFNYLHPHARDDTEGVHITPYDIPFNEFVSTLLQDKLIKDIMAQSVVLDEHKAAVDKPGSDKGKLRDILSIAVEKTEYIMPIYLSMHSFSNVSLQDTVLRKTENLSFAATGNPVFEVKVPKQSIARLFAIQFYYQQAVAALGEAKRGGNYEDVDFFINKIYAIDSDYPFAHVLKAEMLGRQDKWKEAIVVYESVLNSYPRLLYALDGVGRAYYKVGEYAKSLKAFETISKQYPQWWEPYYWQGNVCYAMEDYDKARKLYHRALEVLEEAVKEAKKEFFTLIDDKEVDKDRAMIKNAIAFVYIATGTHPLAETYLSQSLALDQENTSALFNSGLSYHMQGKLDKAIEQYKKVLTVDKESLLANWYLAKAYAQAGQYVEAIKFYEEALLLKPDNAQRRDIYLDMGIAYLNEKNDPAKALFNIRNALALDPENIKIKYYLASAYLFLNEDDQAEYYLKQIIEKDNTFAYAYQDLGLICFKRKDFAKAKANFIKAKELFEAQGNKEAAEVLQPYLVFDPEKFPFPETTK